MNELITANFLKTKRPANFEELNRLSQKLVSVLHVGDDSKKEDVAALEKLDRISTRLNNALNSPDGKESEELKLEDEVKDNGNEANASAPALEPNDGYISQGTAGSEINESTGRRRRVGVVLMPPLEVFDFLLRDVPDKSTLSSVDELQRQMLNPKPPEPLNVSAYIRDYVMPDCGDEDIDARPVRSKKKKAGNKKLKSRSFVKSLDGSGSSRI